MFGSEQILRGRGSDVHLERVCRYHPHDYHPVLQVEFRICKMGQTTDTVLLFVQYMHVHLNQDLNVLV